MHFTQLSPTLVDAHHGRGGRFWSDFVCVRARARVCVCVCVCVGGKMEACSNIYLFFKTVFPPRLRMTCKRVRILMETLIKTWGIFHHIWRNAASNCYRFVGDFSNLRNLLPITSYTCSIGSESALIVIVSWCFILKNNARPHTARIVINFLEENNIEMLQHLPMSADLNPIEHVWDMIERRLWKLEEPP